MSEQSQPEATPAESPAPRATLLVAALVAVAALALGSLGTLMFTGGPDGPAAEEPSPLNAGDVAGRAENLGAETDAAERDAQGQADDASEEAAEAATGTTPADDAFAQRLAEEEARLAERARLASDSALTPPVTDIAALVEGWRPKGPESGTSSDATSQPPVPVAGTGAAPQGSAATAAPALQPAAATAPETAAPTHLLARGSVIPTVLDSSIDSDLPGLVRAKVAETVFDTLSGSHVLIPRGSWLVGTYGSNAGPGQRRLFVSWTDLLLPDGTPVPLDGTGSLGADGASGVRGRRSTGLWTAFGAAVLFDLAGNASQILIAKETGQAPGRQGVLAELLGEATGNSTRQVAQQYLGELLARGTRFRVDAGARMNVLVEEDLRLPAQPVRGAWR